MNEAMSLHVEGRHAESEALYRRIIAEHPDLPDPRHYLGFLLLQTGRLDESLGLIVESLDLDDSRAEWHFNHGIVLARLGRNEEAILAFVNSLKLSSGNYFCWTNLGSLLEKAGEPGKAEEAYIAATRLDPECPDAYYLLSTLLCLQERFREAKYFSCLGFIADPAKDKSRIRLGIAYHETGRAEDAVATMENWLKEEPENPVPAHMITAFTGAEPPERCSSRYVEATFDRFAPRFDATLASLKYAGPELLEKELRRLDFAKKSLHVLDLGCGTGLNGACLKPLSLTLTGIDISRAMLDKAEERSCYDQLFKSEICEFLGDARNGFELITCMDALIYFGNLVPVFSGVLANLKSGGMFIFTTEKFDVGGGKGYDLDITGRYRHGEKYLSDLLADTGFTTISMADVVIRHESGNPVKGQLFTVQKPG